MLQYHASKDITRIRYLFRALLKKSYSLAPSLREFFRQEGSPRIWIILVSHTLLVLVSRPLFIPGITLHLTFFKFWPAVKDKLAVVARAVKQVMKFKLIGADFFEGGWRTGILVQCLSH